jgi:peroxiredoxin Q/BCP
MTTSTSLQAGDPAPPFQLLDQHEVSHSLEQYRGRPVFVYFYPKASTPGCTQQACHLRDLSGDIGDAVVLGISPDSPRRLANFDEKHSLGFTLLSDPDHEVAESYGAWGEKKNYGKVYMGIIRSAVLVDADGNVAQTWPTLSPKATPDAIVGGLESLSR